MVLRVGHETVAPGPGVATCFVPPTPERKITKPVSPEQEFFIVTLSKIWPNNSIIHYHLAPETSVPRVKVEDMQQSVRDAFQEWKDAGIGLEFVEVENAAEAEIRVTFNAGGSSSFVGTDNIRVLYPTPTMNFGWDQTKATGQYDTSLHEVGHAIGAQHEHQNWNAGIEWDEDACIRHFRGPPNFWAPETTRFNIIRKLSPRLTEAGLWDKDSIMHYTLQPGLAISPEEVRRFGVRPQSGLTEQDRQWVRTFYPPPEPGVDMRIALEPFRSKLLDFTSGEQREYLLSIETSKMYIIGTFGNVDSKMSIYEVGVPGEEPMFLDEDDDSGEDRNARLTIRLLRGRQYEVRVRMVFGAANSASIMYF